MSENADDFGRPSNGQIITPTNMIPASEIEKALTSWGKTMDMMLSARFGKQKIGYMLLLAPLGNKTAISWISSLDLPSLRAITEHLNNVLRTKDEDQLRLKKENFGG